MNVKISTFAILIEQDYGQKPAENFRKQFKDPDQEISIFACIEVFEQIKPLQITNARPSLGRTNSRDWPEPELLIED
ncbi:MAG: hypothetical protein KGJ35_01795 [Patescibacteria group bacterium]|nr:hypothetical protein [Patescibacteria group bacterium]